MRFSTSFAIIRPVLTVDAGMKPPNQIDRKRDDVSVTGVDLLRFGPEEPITDQGLRTNVSVGVQYLEAWLRGSGAVPIFNLMEDAATAEISRAQVWQWIRSPKGKLADGRKVTDPLPDLSPGNFCGGGIFH